MTAPVLVLPFAAALALPATVASGPAPQTVEDAALNEANQPTPDISTAEFAALVASGADPVLDVRSGLEYAIAHVPGSINLWEKEVEHVVERYPDRSRRLVLYCNGPFCGKSKRLAEKLAQLGYTHVRRYQLGLPIWRALGHTVQTDLDGVRYVWGGDRTAVWVDARPRDDRKDGALACAVDVAAGEAEKANEDGRLPQWDKGTRVIVFGRTVEQARTVAAEVARKAYWNSSYFGGTFDDLAKAGLIRDGPCPGRPAAARP